MAKNKEIAKKEEVASIVPAEAGQAWGATTTDSEDIIIPRAMLMQAMSEFVSDGIASVGDFVNSMDPSEVICKKGESFGAIFFGLEKKIMAFIDDKFDHMEDYTSNYVREEVTESGAILTRKTLMNYFFLRPEDLEAGVIFPYVLSFRSTSMRAGKTLATLIKKLEVMKKPSAARVFEITVKQEKNEKGQWWTPVVTMGRESSTEEMNAAYQWYKTLMNSNVTAHEDVAEDAQEEVGTGKTHSNATAPTMDASEAEREMAGI